MLAPTMAGSRDNTRMASEPATAVPANDTRPSMGAPCWPMVPRSSAVAMASASERYRILRSGCEMVGGAGIRAVGSGVLPTLGSTAMRSGKFKRLAYAASLSVM